MVDTVAFAAPAKSLDGWIVRLVGGHSCNGGTIPRFHRPVAPREIDYVSIDTEGSELAILQAFDFADFDIKIMTVEHNFIESNRQEVFKLLSGKGFMRLFESLSKFDDWYVKRSLIGL